METEKQSKELLTLPDPLDHYAELLRIRQKGTRRDSLLAIGASVVFLLIGFLLALNHARGIVWLAGGVGFVSSFVMGVVKRSEYVARNELLRLLEVLHCTEKGVGRKL